MKNAETRKKAYVDKMTEKMLESNEDKRKRIQRKKGG